MMLMGDDNTAETNEQGQQMTMPNAGVDECEHRQT